MSPEDQFEFRNENPKFLCRDGPARSEAEAHSEKKLCFTATRRDLLARHLLELSARPDCVFVKFGVHARDGMYQGRCFLTTDQAVADVWAQYKLHPSLFCTVQDDAFTAPHRRLADAYDNLWLDDDTRSPEVLRAAKSG